MTDLSDRVSTLEGRLDEMTKHLATKAWVLGGVLGGMGVAAGVAVALIKLFP